MLGLPTRFIVALLRRLRPSRTAHTGRHRPDTVVRVAPDWGLRYPLTYRRYARFGELYGYGRAQTYEWARRTARRAELLARREAREALRAAERARENYGWLRDYEDDVRKGALTVMLALRGGIRSTVAQSAARATTLYEVATR